MKTVDARWVREFFDYNSKTGALTWKKSCGARCRIGHQVGWMDPNYGYRCVGIYNRNYRVPRLIWLFVTGKMPKGQIDHINGIRDDNRIENLRDVSQEINCQNRRFAKRNTLTGILGLSKDRHGFIAQIRVNKRNVFLGRFHDANEAYAVYLEAKRRLHPGNTL